MWVFNRQLSVWYPRTSPLRSVALASPEPGDLCKVICSSSRQGGNWEIVRLGLEVTHLASSYITRARTQPRGHTGPIERLGAESSCVTRKQKWGSVKS